ncbi:extracellular solute-binding protein [Luteimicrobium sp. NPDC057192]|uniref:extracellular solute-binding protein n=1 Tax=Luteimicrobium sp. NPDC057192 TaxID=3346042 RepID=UPI00363186F2
MSRTRPRPAARAAVAVATAALALGLAACSGSSSAADKVAVVGYSVPQPAYDALEAAFQKTDAGKGVAFTSSFGASGSQSKAVAAGQKADYVAFSVEPDVQNLVPAKVDAGWNADETKGNVSDSVVVIVTRKGNPKQITGWDDIVEPGVKIVTADPASSGSAKWNILAAYEHEVATGGTEADAKAYLTEFFGNTVSRASSGAIAMTQFLGGTGDVLISYENEVIAARQAGNDVDYVVPDDTFLIENPAAVTKTASKPAKDFLAFAKSDDGQKIFASKGFRPVSTTVDVGTVEGANDPSKPFPEVAKLTTIADLGGWDAVNKKFFGDSGLVTAIEGDA